MSDQVDYDAVRGASAAAWAEKKSDEEKARRLDRYDEAIKLLRECVLYTDNSDFDNKVIAFLAAEPKEGRR